ncbi:MAG: tol-pal system protein YbgF [Desulfuromonadales bacterium]
MTIWRKGFSALILGASLSACIPTQQQLVMERDLGEMKRRLAEVERSAVASRQDGNRESAQRLDALVRAQADQQAILDSLRVELQAITGRFEDLGRERAETRDELTLMRDDLALKITAVEDRLNKLEAAARAPALPPAAAEAPESLYERGVELIQKKEQFVKGREAMQEYLQRNPQGALSVNAMYWIGESYYGEKKYENAILQFQDVIQKYKEHPKVAAALLKQGFAFSMLGDKKNARVILQRLVDTFPLSQEAKKAKERLQEWQKEKS